MATTNQIADWIIGWFDPTKSHKVEAAILAAMLAEGCSQNAADIACEKAAEILGRLRSLPTETLPFVFSEADRELLIGKQRPRAGDNHETLEARKLVNLVEPMLQAIYECGPRIFEKICARLISLYGALEAFAICAADDGGIDVYGRLPIKLQASSVTAGLFHSVLLDRPILFFGQCKCNGATRPVGRPDLSKFDSSTRQCISYYEGNPQPPSNRVPQSYYRKDELYLKLFFTTSTFSEDARAAAKGLDTALVDGDHITHLLLLYKIGLTALSEDQYIVDKDKLRQWAEANG